MRAVLRLLELIVRFIQRAIDARAQRIRQAQRDELESDPVGFFDAHFDGVRRPKARDADKADPWGYPQR
jgi:hypothetical protein